MLVVQRYCGCHACSHLASAAWGRLPSRASEVPRSRRRRTSLSSTLSVNWSTPLPRQVRATLVPSLDRYGGYLSAIPGAAAPAVIIEGVHMHMQCSMLPCGSPECRHVAMTGGTEIIPSHSHAWGPHKWGRQNESPPTRAGPFTLPHCWAAVPRPGRPSPHHPWRNRRHTHRGSSQARCS